MQLLIKNLSIKKDKLTNLYSIYGVYADTSYTISNKYIYRSNTLSYPTSNKSELITKILVGYFYGELRGGYNSYNNFIRSTGLYNSLNGSSKAYYKYKSYSNLLNKVKVSNKEKLRERCNREVSKLLYKEYIKYKKENKTIPSTIIKIISNSTGCSVGYLYLPKHSKYVNSIIKEKEKATIFTNSEKLNITLSKITRRGYNYIVENIIETAVTNTQLKLL